VKLLAPVTRDRSNKPSLCWHLIVPLLLCLISCHAAHAEFDLVPHVSVQYENNSNIFAVPDSRAVLAPDGTPTLDDSTLNYIAGLAINYNASHQKFYVSGEWRRIDYDTFTQFDHDEYTYAAGLDWKLTHLFDGVLSARQDRTMESYADIAVTQLILNTRSDINGQFNINLGSHWRTELVYDTSDLKAPLPTAPDYGQKEWVGTGRIKYLTATGLALGIEEIYEESEVVGTNEDINIRTTTSNFVATYAATERFQLNASVGKAVQHRIETGDDDPSTVWDVAIVHQMTGKTSFTLNFYQRYVANAAAASTEVNTGGTAQINWKATGKIEVSVSYTDQSTRFPLPYIDNTIDPNRKDDDRISQLTVNYFPLSWLDIRPYYIYEQRDSSDSRLSYEATKVGLVLLATFK
jgi:hypothetical protein